MSDSGSLTGRCGRRDRACCAVWALALPWRVRAARCLELYGVPAKCRMLVATDLHVSPFGVLRVAHRVLSDERFRSCFGGEVDVDSEAAAGSGLCGDGGVVGVGDRLYDGEAEPDPVGRGAWVRAESLERLEEAGELAGRDHGSGVRDREGGASCGGVRGDVEPAAGNVVTDGVRDQVRDEALDQLRVAGFRAGSSAAAPLSSCSVWFPGLRRRPRRGRRAPVADVRTRSGRA